MSGIKLIFNTPGNNIYSLSLTFLSDLFFLISDTGLASNSNEKTFYVTANYIVESRKALM